MNQETYISSSGAQLNLYSLLPPKEVKAIIHVAHGMVEHAFRYSRFANELCKSGYAVYTHDIRGHGHTLAEDAPQGEREARCLQASGAPFGESRGIP